LARTIIEGGRHYDSAFDRRLRNRRLRRVRYDEEGDPIGRDVDPGTSCLYHHDRLAPLERWLRRNVGRPWRKVYEEGCEIADIRTTKGWHFRDHLRMAVSEAKGLRVWADFYVDEKGFLRERHREPRPRERYWGSPWTPHLDWADGRRVIVQGEALFWTVDRVDPASPQTFVSRQGCRLTEAELAYWSALSDRARDDLRYVPAASRVRSVRGTSAHGPRRS
jgi:hypothetical protein